jgi:hypothetical protein
MNGTKLLSYTYAEDMPEVYPNARLNLQYARLQAEPLVDNLSSVLDMVHIVRERETRNHRAPIGPKSCGRCTNSGQYLYSCTRRGSKVRCKCFAENGE